LNELFNAVQRGFIYDDGTTSCAAVSLLNSQNINPQDLWLIRCSPKRDAPYTITYTKSRINDHEFEISHQRILFNVATRQYIFQNLRTKEIIMNESINNLMDRIKREYKFGQGLLNMKLNIIKNPQNLDFHHYEGDSIIPQ